MGWFTALTDHLPSGMILQVVFLNLFVGVRYYWLQYLDVTLGLLGSKVSTKC